MVREECDETEEIRGNLPTTARQMAANLPRWSGSTGWSWTSEPNQMREIQAAPPQHYPPFRFSEEATGSMCWRNSEAMMPAPKCVLLSARFLRVCPCCGGIERERERMPFVAQNCWPISSHNIAINPSIRPSLSTFVDWAKDGSQARCVVGLPPPHIYPSTLAPRSRLLSPPPLPLPLPLPMHWHCLFRGPPKAGEPTLSPPITALLCKDGSAGGPQHKDAVPPYAGRGRGRKQSTRTGFESSGWPMLQSLEAFDEYNSHKARRRRRRSGSGRRGSREFDPIKIINTGPMSRITTEPGYKKWNAGNNSTRRRRLMDSKARASSPLRIIAHRRAKRFAYT